MRYVVWVLLLCGLCGGSIGEAKVVYVDSGATGEGSGSDWANACTTITAGLALSASGDEVWVKSATYGETIALKEGVALYGGFPAEASPAFEDRDWAVNATVVDATGLDTHVVIGADDAVLDGFLITGGVAEQGGGVYCQSCSPTIANCTIAANRSEGSQFGNGGGGVYCYLSSVTLIDCVIADNSAYWGGGFFSYYSSPTLTRCRIAGNRAVEAAALLCRGTGPSPKLSKCTIEGNTAEFGAPVWSSLRCSPSFVNCRISGNSGGTGAISCSEFSFVTLANCTIAGNRGDAISNQGDSILIATNCILWNLGVEIAGYWDWVEVTYSCVQSGLPGEGNFDARPLFVDAANGDYRLQDGSPCVDRGLLSAAPSDDIEGQPRPGGDGLVDVGAYESPDAYGPGPAMNAPSVFHVRTDAPEGGDGSSWEFAFRRIGLAFEVVSTSDEIWVAGGRYAEHVTFEERVSLFGGFQGWETLREERNWIANPTVIDASAAGGFAVVAALGGTLDGFIVTGGGVLCHGCSPTLTHCNITGNSGLGGVVCAYGASPVIENCTLANNSSIEHGGGLRCSYRSSPTLVNCLIAGNTARAGSGLYCSMNCLPSLVNCTIVDNRAAENGAVYCSSSSPSLTNCILWNQGEEINPVGSSSVTVTYSCIQGGWSGEGNIAVHPEFVNSASGDYRLTNGSSCVDRGLLAVSPAEDIVGNPRPGEDGLVDMGVYESPDEYEPVPSSIVPKTIFVRADSPQGGDGSSWESALSTITAALEIVATSDEVWVAEGRYGESVVMEPSVAIYGGFSGSEELKEERDWVAHETVIDATGLGRSAVIGSNNAMLAGFAITGGTAGSGGGLFCGSCSPTLTDCTITGNWASRGAGVHCDYHSSPTLVNCSIVENKGRFGVGLDCLISSHPVLKNCLIVDNSASPGSIVLCSMGCSPMLTNCTIARNSATESAALECQEYGSLGLTNCILWNVGEEIVEESTGSVRVTFSCIQGGWQGVSNIDADPVFANADNGDYRLTAASPCIDAGSNEAAAGILTDLDGNVRIWDGDDVPGAVVDMGAYEYGSVSPTPTPTPTVTLTPTVTRTPTVTPTATATPVLGDTTGDGIVDALDLFFFSRWWHQLENETNFRCDCVDDNVIDEYDLHRLMMDW